MRRVIPITVLAFALTAAPASAVKPRKAARVARVELRSFKRGVAGPRSYRTSENRLIGEGDASGAWDFTFHFRMRVRGQSAPIVCDGHIGVTVDARAVLGPFTCVA